MKIDKLLKHIVALVVASAMLLFMTRPVKALDTAITISLVSTGVVTGVLLIAIIGSSLSDDDPRILLQPEKVRLPRNDSGIRFGLQCPQSAEGVPAVCW